ncbi:MAG: hypothetical protein Tp156SUR915002_32 [Prokaryotic dsDNA virus sp.]|nr:MAG: hypothetical protein Tp162SUR384061_41 [Prokaryotic dsDNA virus sp.]QDP59771.1 MAG: hypothetical protein Tp156SUR915002_32 [Prokaryotic dsDNA virus sp.]
MDYFTRRIKSAYKLVREARDRRRRRIKYQSLLFKRPTYKFMCPYCDRLMEVTHLYWESVECLYCGFEIANSKAELI